MQGIQEYIKEDDSMSEIELPPPPQKPSWLQVLASKISQFFDDAMRYKTKVFESLY